MDGPDKVICVVGMGGSGKTTLARKTFESEEDTLKSFPCRAWITVSQSFSRRVILQDMITKLCGVNTLNELLKQPAGKVLEQNLASYLRQELQDKRYFIVFDDLWEMDHWNCISVALPMSNNRGSRIIVTTRYVGLAMHCTSENYIYHLKHLQIHEAIKLLQRKTKITDDDMNNDENLRTLITKVVKKCGYLPLAIVTIGGVLATKKTAEWDNFYKNLPSELEDNPSLEAVRRVVTLSYTHLPSRLKPCLLYLSIFPEDYEIKRNHLIGRWIAEGFVRAKVGTTIDKVGKEYFDELIGRSMIQPSRLGIEGSTVKTCRVHDIMRDIIVSISREENFVDLIQSNGSHIPEENFRHVAYHDSKCRKEAMDWKHIRSLTFFTEDSGGWGLDLTPSISTPKLRMLRVLDLVGENFSITQDGMNKIVLLCHLKYLNVRSYESSIYSLPSDIGKMQGLQILDMRPTYIITLPTEITKLEDLRIIRCQRARPSVLDPNAPVRCLFSTLCLPIMIAADSGSRSSLIGELHMGCYSGWSRTAGNGVRVPRGIGNLKELQILESVDIRRTSSKAIKELGELTRLRKLNMETKGASMKKCKILCASIEKLSSLRSLSVRASGHQDRGLGWLISSSSPPPHLRSLKLAGYIGEMTGWLRNLTQLVKIYLEGSQLEDDKIMEILGELPKLMLFQFSYYSYLGEKLVFVTGAFRNLKTLEVWCQNNVKEIRFEKGTSPEMERIVIGGCYLRSGIIGVKHLPRLKVISLYAPCKVGRLGVLEEEVNAHPNHPVLRLSHDRSNYDLGDVEGSNVEVEATESVPDHAGEISQVITLATTDSEIQTASS